jgi:hypothetical protein
MKNNTQRNSGCGNNRSRKLGSLTATPEVPKLCDLGVTKSQSSRWQQPAALPKDEQERRITAA